MTTTRRLPRKTKKTRLLYFMHCIYTQFDGTYLLLSCSKIRIYILQSKLLIKHYFSIQTKTPESNKRSKIGIRSASR